MSLEKIIGCQKYNQVNFDLIKDGSKESYKANNEKHKKIPKEYYKVNIEKRISKE